MFQVPLKVIDCRPSRRLTCAARRPPSPARGRSCPRCDPWPARRDACGPSTSPCARRRSLAARCAGRRWCPWTCDARDGRAPTHRCGSGRRLSGRRLVATAAATEPCTPCGPRVDAPPPWFQVLPPCPGTSLRTGNNTLHLIQQYYSWSHNRLKGITYYWHLFSVLDR